MTTDALAAQPLTRPQQPPVRRALAAVARRWPTALALPLGVDAVLGVASDGVVRVFGDLLPLLPLIYVVVAAVGDRRFSWPVLAAGGAGTVGLLALDGVQPVVVLLAVTLAAAIWGAGHGRHRERDFRTQLAGMALFGGLAVAGMLAAPDVARFLVAAGWIGHGVWDFVHLARNRVVARSFAEWCGVLDLLIGASLILAVFR